MRLPLLALALSAAPAAADWKSLVDPPPDAPAPWAVAPGLNAPTPKASHDADVTFAAHGGPFAAVGSNRVAGDGRAVIDLRTGETAFTLAGELRANAPFALSRDGKQFAAQARGLRGDVIAVFDLATGGKVLVELPTGRHGPKAIAFAGPDRLAIRGWDTIQVFDLATGKRLADIKASPHDQTGPVPTPGGKYLAVADEGQVHLHDAGTGDEVAALTLPKAGPGITRAEGLAVSPDGTKLAALSGFVTKFRLVVWSLADGKVLTDLPSEPARHSPYAPKLAWSADGTAVLVGGDAVLDPATGKSVLTVPGQGQGHERTQRLAVTPTAIVYLDSADRSDRRLKVHALTADQATAARAAVAAGGSAADALLPPLKPLDEAQAKAVVVRLATAKWAAKVEPVSAIELSVPVPLPVPVTDLESVRVAGGADPAAVLESARRAGFDADPTSPRTVRRVDLDTGRVTNQFELPPGVKVAHAGPGGHGLITVDIAEGRRVDVWDVGSGKHVQGCRPFADEKVVLAALPAAGRAVAVSTGGRVVGWTVPDGKVLFAADVPGLTGPGVTPDGRYVYGTQTGRVRFLDAADGTPAGDLVAPFAAAPTQLPVTAAAAAAVVRPDGREAAAVLVKPGAGAQLVRWDLATGAVIDATPTPPSAPPGPQAAPYPGAAAGWAVTTPVYVGGGFLLAGGKNLYDPARQAVVWHFPLGAGGRPAAQRPDARYWYVIPAAPNQNGVLVGADLPGDEAAKTIAAVTNGKAAVFKPGTGVRVRLAFEGSSAKAAEEKVVEWVKAAIIDRKMVPVGADEDVTVTVQVAERDTGKKRQYRMLGTVGFFGPQVESVRVLELDCAAKVSADGETLYAPPPEVLKIKADTPGITIIPAGEKDVEKYFHRTLWDQVPGWAERTALPRFLAKTPDGVKALPGSTPLTAAGPAP